MHTLRSEGLDFLVSASRVLRFETTVPAEPAAVFDALAADPATWTTWFPNLRAGRYRSTEPHGVGSLREVTVRGAGTYQETLLAWDRPTRWTYRVDATSLGLADALVEDWSLAPEGDGTRVTYTFAVDPRPLFRLGLRVAPGLVGGTFRKAMRNLAGRLGRN